MDKQGKAFFVNRTIHCTLKEDFRMKIFLVTTFISARLNRLLEIALKVSQSILRCGDGLIHGRVHMTRLLMCIMGMFSIIKFIAFHISFLQYTTKYKHGVLVVDTIIINAFDKYNDS